MDQIWRRSITARPPNPTPPRHISRTWLFTPRSQTLRLTPIPKNTQVGIIVQHYQTALLHGLLAQHCTPACKASCQKQERQPLAPAQRGAQHGILHIGQGGSGPTAAPCHAPDQAKFAQDRRKRCPAFGHATAQGRVRGLEWGQQGASMGGYLPNH